MSDEIPAPLSADETIAALHQLIYELAQAVLYFEGLPHTKLTPEEMAGWDAYYRSGPPANPVPGPHDGTVSLACAIVAANRNREHDELHANGIAHGHEPLVDDAPAI